MLKDCLSKFDSKYNRIITEETTTRKTKNNLSNSQNTASAKMKFVAVFCVLSFLAIFVDRTSGDIITFNSEPEEIEDNMEAILETEQLLSLSRKQDYKPKLPQSFGPPPLNFPSNNSQLNGIKPTLGPNTDSTFTLKGGGNSAAGSTGAVLGVGQSNVKTSNVSSPGFESRKEKSSLGQAQWEEIGTATRSDNLDLFFSPEDFDDDLLLSRSKRQINSNIVLGSGEIAVTFQLRLSGTLTGQQAVGGSAENIALKVDIGEGLRVYLESSLPGVNFQVFINSLTPGSIIVDGEIVYIEEDATRINIAQSFYDLDILNQLKLNNVIYTVDFPLLGFVDPSTQSPAICFLCAVYETCQTVDGLTNTCVLADERFYPFGVAQGDSALTKDQEFASATIVFDTEIPWGDQPRDRMWISVNGIISFGAEFTSFSPQALPVNNLELLAVYWSDLDLVSSDPSANVFYQLYTMSPTQSAATSAILALANAQVVQYSPDGQTSYDALEVAVVTWDGVPPWPAGVNKAERVTFQCVVISDGITTYVSYLYGNGAMNFDPMVGRAVTVGFANANFDILANYYIFDEIVGNTGEAGRWFFKIGQESGSRAQCKRFYNTEVLRLDTINAQNNRIRPCPCNEFLAAVSGLWVNSFEQARCYEIFPLPVLGQYGRRCCYRLDGSGNFENLPPLSGSFQMVNPYFNFPQALPYHDALDTLPKRWCCQESNLCDLYYQVRPTRGCINSRSRRAQMMGDPHVTTLDQNAYIFNGLGEYEMIRINGVAPDNATVDFSMQGRTCIAKQEDGRPTAATIWCAIALRNTNGSTAHVEVHSSGNYLVIYVNGEDFTARFRDQASFEEFDEGMYMRKVNGSLRLFTPDNVGLTISLSNGLLDIVPSLDIKYEGMTSGLLGNFNNDPLDDFTMPNGTVLASDAAETQIYAYGQLWAVTQENSVFRYEEGQTTASFRNDSFTPIFLDEQNATVRAEAETVCQGSTNIPCIFDFIATRNAQLALATKTAIDTYDKEEIEIANEAPVLTGPRRINASVDQTTVLTFNATDPGDPNLEYVFIASPSSQTFSFKVESGILTADFTPVDTSAVSIQLVAQDQTGLQSEISEVEVVMCSLCSNRGTCDYTNLQRPTNSSSFLIAPCVCQAPYDGEDCELDKDGCFNNPCPQHTNCTDVTATEEETTGNAYNCTACPTGLQLNGTKCEGLQLNGTKCEDINECLVPSSCPANSDCTNTFGGFLCTCKNGFRKSSTGTCEDINECVENNQDCEQICVNTVGSYSCACEPGYDLDPVIKLNCSLVADPCAGLTAPKCSYGCRNNSGEAQCFCRVGYKLAADGVTCQDINECSENLCSQQCNNTVGSFSCSCLPGFTLDSDGLTCNPCPQNFYGEGCKQRCECRGRSVSCDNVRGCICNSAWTGMNCETDVNECDAASTSPCPADKLCRNVKGSFLCECPEGFEDPSNSGTCTDINECLTPSVHQCADLCVNNPGSYSCQCRTGFNLVNGTCVDINECETGTSGCQQLCRNQQGSYNCECRPGFVLADDRSSCIKEEEVCRGYNLTCQYACQVVNSLPECYCQIGYTLSGDGVSCLDINECNDPTINKCGGDCVNIPGSYVCTCPIGQELQNDQRTCQACDEYHWGLNCNNTCACNPRGSSVCDKTLGCQCLSGWQGNTCYDDINECDFSTSPCPSASQCINSVGSYICSCGTGYTEQNGACVDINECESAPCDHICNNTMGSYFCSCFKGFRVEGDNCIDINECAVTELNRCEQKCRNNEGGYRCECYEGYQLNVTTRTSCYALTSSNECSAGNGCSDFCRVDNGQDICYCSAGYELDTDNSTCKDINECLATPCVGGTCTNLLGGFTCSCEAGLKLAADKVTCQACEVGQWGVDCADTCACNGTNTVECLAHNGSCVCESGWEGNTCSDDINECDTVTCQTNAVCNNSPGSYRCVCNIGYVSSAGQCVACDSTHYGQDCSQVCPCNVTNTQDCNDQTGACTCLTGWEGNTCSQDINECTVNNPYCTGPFETCNNIDGGAQCLCQAGYVRPNIGANCTECDPVHFGPNCASPCTCVFANTEDCNNVNGTCTCKTGWSGTSCSVDINECLDPNYCGQLEECINLNGSAQCGCIAGYETGNNGNCQDINECLDPSLDTCVAPQVCNNTIGSLECIRNMRSIPIKIVLAYSNGSVDNGIFNNTTPAFRSFRLKIETAMNNFGRVTVGVQFFRFSISRFVPGSVIVEGTAQIDENLSTNPEGDAVRFAHSLYNNGSLLVDGSTVDVSGGEVGSTTIQSSTSVCELFNPLTACDDGTACTDVNGTPKCEPIQPSDSDYELIIGLGVGIPMFVLLTVVVAILVYVYVSKRKQLTQSASSTPSVDRDAPFRSVFATQMPTKGSWGAPARFQMYSPDAYSEAATSESSGDGQLLKARQKGRSDFQDSPWYDQRGAMNTPREATDSRGAPTEAAGPTSNFSWEYMFRLLEPHREFGIQRPNLSPAPNPMYTPRSGKKPDSMA